MYVFVAENTPAMCHESLLSSLVGQVSLKDKKSEISSFRVAHNGQKSRIFQNFGAHAPFVAVLGACGAHFLGCWGAMFFVKVPLAL